MLSNHQNNDLSFSELQDLAALRDCYEPGSLGHVVITKILGLYEKNSELLREQQQLIKDLNRG